MKNALLVFLLLLPTLCLAQAKAQKTAVYFSCTCSDNAGELYATALRDAIASSPRYTQANMAEEKDSKGKVAVYNWNIAAVSLDPSDGHDGLRTVISITLLLGNHYFVTSIVQTCGRDVAASCAGSTLASLDAEVNQN